MAVYRKIDDLPRAILALQKAYEHLTVKEENRKENKPEELE